MDAQTAEKVVSLLSNEDAFKTMSRFSFVVKHRKALIAMLLFVFVAVLCGLFAVGFNVGRSSVDRILSASIREARDDLSSALSDWHRDQLELIDTTERWRTEMEQRFNELDEGRATTSELIGDFDAWFREYSESVAASARRYEQVVNVLSGADGSFECRSSDSKNCTESN